MYIHLFGNLVELLVFFRAPRYWRCWNWTCLAGNEQQNQQSFVSNVDMSLSWIYIFVLKNHPAHHITSCASLCSVQVEKRFLVWDYPHSPTHSEGFAFYALGPYILADFGSWLFITCEGGPAVLQHCAGIVKPTPQSPLRFYNSTPHNKTSQDKNDPHPSPFSAAA